MRYVLIALLPGGLIVLAAWHLLRLSACRHVDERGQSLLYWTHHEGRLRGWCPDCERYTHGWSVPARQQRRAPIAKKVA